MSVDFKQLQELLSAIAQTDITELTLKSDDFELKVKKGTTASSQELLTSVSPANLPLPAQPLITTPVANSQNSEPASPTKNTEQQKWVEVTSPMVGTFYRAPSPDDAPFVDIGERISNGDTVCIIEAMKLMNDIEAEVSGEVMEILVQNGEPVEYGQVLMRVNPG